MSKTITSQRAIAKVLSTAKVGTCIKITWTAITSQVWRHRFDDREAIVGADKEGIGAYLISDIATGTPNLCTVISKWNDGRVVVDTGRERIVITAEHVASLCVVPSPTTHRVDGMTKDIVLHPEGHAVVGCQTITRKGLQQIHALLTKHLAATAAAD